MREDFFHIFYSCPSVIPLRNTVCRNFFPQTVEPVTEKVMFFTGFVNNASVDDNFFFILTSILFNYGLWYFKQKKSIPSMASLLNEIDFNFDNILTASSRVKKLALKNNTAICRRWRDSRDGGRG